MVKLEEHKVYVDIQKMDMVPYTVAVQAVEEAVKAGKIAENLDTLMDKLSQELSSIDPNINLDELNY